jgi:uncharacterized membrane protein
MKFTRRTIALVGAVACCAVALGAGASPASADTAQGKSQSYHLCLASGNTAKNCCEAFGGVYEEQRDADGNVEWYVCTFHSDPTGAFRPPPIPGVPVPPSNPTVIVVVTPAQAPSPPVVCCG